MTTGQTDTGAVVPSGNLLDLKSVLMAYARDIRKHGKPLDSGLPDVLERTAKQLTLLRDMLSTVANHGDCACYQDDDCPFVWAKRMMSNVTGERTTPAKATP